MSTYTHRQRLAVAGAAMTAPERTCECDKTYTDDASGRHNHRVLHGHPPAPPRNRLTGQWVAGGRTAERGQ